MESHAFYLTYRKHSKKPELSFGIGGTTRESTIIKLKGKYVDEIFNELLSTLSRYGAVIPVEVAEHERTYTIREDLGPLVGAYLILLRRARNYEKWHKFLEQLLEEEYPGVASALAGMLDITLELLKSLAAISKKNTSIAPPILDAMSSTLKQFVKSIEKAYRNFSK
jgi:hypothetical protein